jgi:threonine aldolase
VFDWEDGAAAAWAGAQLRPVPTPDGVLTADAVRSAIRSGSPYQPRTSLICVENTHNAAGGRVVPIEVLADLRDVAGGHGLPVHLDGARLWNASVASGTGLERYGAVADTIMVTLSKGLGCPVGSLLAGDEDAIGEAWRIRRRLGGSMRQSGILAAAGLFALDHNIARLAEDHRRASLLARLADELDGVHTVPPDTNIVMLDLLRDAPDAATVVADLGDRGVLVTAFASHRLRAVTHMDVDDEAIRSAVDALADILARRH